MNLLSGPAANATDPYAESRALLERASLVTPGGVNTARRKIDPPVCFREGSGAYVTDLGGRRYIDFQAAYGAILLGHSHPEVHDRVTSALRTQGLFGVGTTELEVLVAEKIVKHVPCAEQVVMCLSGTEANRYAVRLARAATGRDLVVKFQGNYHGADDGMLVSTMSQPDRIGQRDLMSAGMLRGTTDGTLVARYNDLDSVNALFDLGGDQIAAIIVEPIAHNAPSILPAPGFLEGLRDICHEYSALLIFDEVITGFRHGLGGYQGLCGVTPDLSTFAKCLGNGFPVAAIAGPGDLMQEFNTTKTGRVTFAGTFNGGAVGMAAALATIEVLEREEVHEHIFRLGDMMRNGLRDIAAQLGVPVHVSGFGSLFTMLFMEDVPLVHYEDVFKNDRELFAAYGRRLITTRHPTTGHGVFVMPETGVRSHISYAHTADDIAQALDVARIALTAALDDRARGNA